MLPFTFTFPRRLLKREIPSFTLGRRIMVGIVMERASVQSWVYSSAAYEEGSEGW